MSDEDNAKLQARIAELEAANQKLSEESRSKELRAQLAELEAANARAREKAEADHKELEAAVEKARQERLDLARAEQVATQARIAAMSDDSLRVFARSSLDRKTPTEVPHARQLLAAAKPQPFVVELGGAILGAQVSVDGKPVPVRPRNRHKRRNAATIELAPDVQHEVVIEAKGFKPRAMTLSGRPGERRKVDAQLRDKAE